MAALMLLGLSAGCSGQGGKASGDDSAQGEADIIEQFADTLVSPHYAKGFTLLEASEGPLEGAMLLQVTDPWQGANGESRSLLMLPEGKSAPDSYAGRAISWPARRLVVMSSTHVSMLEALGVADRIVGVSGKRYISSPALRARIDDVAEVGHEGNADYEALATARPDLVLLYGVSAANPMEPKLREMGIPYIYIGDYLEEDPLGKAEWLLAIGALTGRLKEAREAFEPVAESYMQTAGLVSSFAKHPYPKVMFNATTGDGWFMPGADSYMVRLIRDAGGEYAYEGNPGTQSKVIGMEEAWRLLSKADYWLNPGSAASMDELRAAEPRMMDAPAVANGKVWNNTLLTNAGGGNDFFESGAVRPDRVLLDLVGILHPELSDSVRAPVYYRHLQ